MQKISPTLFQLVQQLNDLEIHSGESLAAALSLSRNAVWKHIQQLLKYEVAIESLVGKGYQLKEPLNLLDPSRLLAFQKEGPGLRVQQLKLYGSISSTNDEVRLLPKPPENHLVFALAEHQTQGRGRFERKWISPFAKNLMLSARVFLNKDMSSLGGLSLSISLAVRKTLEEIGIQSRCKWPNDLYYCDKKLSGILMEAYAESHGLTELVIGIGLNINMVHASRGETIEKPWVSIQEITSKVQDRTAIALKLIQNIRLYLERFLEKGFQDFQAEWNQHDFLRDQFIHLKMGTQEIAGIARGIDGLGHLKIEDFEGETRAYSAGEASVKW